MIGGGVLVEATVGMDVDSAVRVGPGLGSEDDVGLAVGVVVLVQAARNNEGIKK